MRIGVVGVVVDDVIRRGNGRVARSLGGLAYSVGALSALLGSRGRVVPVCRLAADIASRARAHWTRAGNVSLDGCRSWQGPASRVELDYRGAGAVGGDRDERLIGQTPRLGVDELAPALGCDAILLNCITGPVLDEDALAAVGADAAPPVHLDIHSLLLGIDNEGRRFPERPAEWERWVRVATTLQCNEQEVATLAGADPDQVGRWRGFVRELLSGGTRPRAILVTRGATGAEVHTRLGGWRVSAPEIGVLDPTGAGDCFGAGFVAAAARGEGLPAALASAVAAGSAACTLAGAGQLDRLPAAVRGLRSKPRPARIVH